MPRLRATIGRLNQHSFLRRRSVRKRHRLVGPLRTVGRCGWLPVAEAVEETPEDAAFTGKGGSRRRRDGALAGDGMVVVGAGDGLNDAGLIKVLGAFDPWNVADQHAIAHDLGLKAGRAVGVPLGLAAAGQRHSDTVLVDSATEQVSIYATVTKGVHHPAGSEFVHASEGSRR